MTTLTPHQLEACDRIRDRFAQGHGLALLGGAAGTGKTTCISHLAAALSEDGMGTGVYICTPTHKAAKVLRSKGLKGACTYHSKFFTLKEPPVQSTGDPKAKKASIEFTPNDLLEESGSTLSAGKVRQARLLIIDEASMVCRAHLKDLQRMCKHLLLVGDPHQLPPVENDKGLKTRHTSSLGIFRMENLTAELTEIHRQAEGSPILVLADLVRQKQNPDTAPFHVKPTAKFGQAVKLGVQVVCYTNDTRKFANAKYRERMGRKSMYPEPGDRMVFNDHYQDGARTWLNGETVEVLEFHPPLKDNPTSAGLVIVDEEGTVCDLYMDMVHFWYDQAKGYAPTETAPRRTGVATAKTACLGFAYAITAHKAQGSEYDHVLLIDERSKIQGATPELTAETSRRWFYTCVTRAKHKLHIVRQAWIFSK